MAIQNRLTTDQSREPSTAFHITSRAAGSHAPPSQPPLSDVGFACVVDSLAAAAAAVEPAAACSGLGSDGAGWLQGQSLRDAVTAAHRTRTDMSPDIFRLSVARTEQIIQ